ncbi:hypothetical protein D3H64_00545 [Atopobacter sp. AH10]|uniref:hypothetical protein n=1 Tax=Atopobacter sp. AH10 TaxID=2315861 RepID=UPI000EF1C82D|nr:hypothetical protein [Atopobacter sp. AH10]RLK64054.1 hypothetical protein D3H64_00545 [Atopobacter sp. AH10]
MDKDGKIEERIELSKEIRKAEKPRKSDDEIYNYFFKNLNANGVEYNYVRDLDKKLSSEEIIKRLAGGDMTKGSCASVGLAYIGQKQGWDVLDFRDGQSRIFFSCSANLFKLSKTNGIRSLRADGKSSMTVGNRLLKQIEADKEYYLCVGKHASIVRKTDTGKLQYLELQSSSHNGWIDFDGNPKYTLHERFGCTTTSDRGASSYFDFMIDIAESDFKTQDFKSLLGYINTANSEQRKGTHGTIK